MSKSLLPLEATNYVMTFEDRQVSFLADSEYSYYRAYVACTPPAKMTHWLSTNISFPHWLKVDLGKAFFIDEVSFNPADYSNKALVKDYEIQISTDNDNFSTVYSATFEPENKVSSNIWQQESAKINKQARYVKIIILNSYASNTNWVGFAGLNITQRQGKNIYKTQVLQGGCTA